MSKNQKKDISPSQPAAGLISESVGGYPITFDSIRCQLAFLKGEVLTVIDASLSDPIQRKAAKDLLRRIFRDKTAHFWEICGKPETSPESEGE